MQSSIVAALSLALTLLGLGTYVAAIDVAWSSLPREPSALGDWRVQIFAARDELGRPTCRRNNFGDPQRPLVRIGQICP